MRRWAVAGGAVLLGAVMTACGNYTCYQSPHALDFGDVSMDLTASGAGFDRKAFISMRGRLGLGAGFDVGVDISNPIPVPTSTAGAVPASGTVDLKWQFMHQGDPGPTHWRLIEGAPVSAAVDAAYGAGFNNRYTYVQLITSRRIDDFEPYVAYRYQRVSLAFDPNDEGDLEDAEYTSFGSLVEETGESEFRFHHVFLGVRIHLANGIYFSPEVSYLDGPGDHNIVGSFGFAFGRELRRNTPPD